MQILNIYGMLRFSVFILKENPKLRTYATLLHSLGNYEIISLGYLLLLLTF